MSKCSFPAPPSPLGQAGEPAGVSQRQSRVQDAFVFAGERSGIHRTAWLLFAQVQLAMPRQGLLLRDNLGYSQPALCMP